jgi:hypothetical protein
METLASRVLEPTGTGHESRTMRLLGTDRRRRQFANQPNVSANRDSILLHILQYSEVHDQAL